MCSSDLAGYYGMLLGLGYYAAKKYAPIYISKYAPMHVEVPDYQQMVSNIMSLGVLIFSTIILVLTNFAFGDLYAQPMDGIQSYAVLAGLFILLYNGQRGYNAKWFKIAYYLFYPVHLVIIGLIFFL